MKKGFSLVCVLVILLTLFAGTLNVGAEEIPKMELDPSPPMPGEKLTAVYTQSETPAFFGWYVFDESDVELVDGVTKIKEGADYVKAGLAQYGATIDLPESAAGMYIFVLAGRGADQNYSTIQESEVVKIAGEKQKPEAPPAPSLPKKKITVFGFENVDEGVKIGVVGSDNGPTQIRRPNGEMWNPEAATWASIEWSTFTDLYELVALEDENAPEGKKVGKWTNKVGKTMPEGKGAWTSSLLNIYKDEPRNTYAVGATEFMFWVDASKYYVPAGVTFTPRIAVQEHDEEGLPTSKYSTYLPKAECAFYYQDETEQWIGALADQSGFFVAPVGYKGYIRVPLEGFVPASWNADANPVIQLNNVIQLVFYFFTYEGEDALDSYALLDDLAFAGDELKDKPARYYEPVIDPVEGLVAYNGILDEYVYEDVIGGTKASIKWDPIGDYSKSYSVNLYKLEKDDDDIGTFVKTIDGITDTSVLISGIVRKTLYAAQVFAYNGAGERIAIYDYLKFTTTGAADSGSPSTGDVGIVAAAVMLIISSAAIFVLVRRKKTV